MFQYYKYNKSSILTINARKHSIILLCILLFISFLIIFCWKFKFNKYLSAKLLVSCENTCKYTLYSSLENAPVIINSSLLKFEKNNYPYKIKEVTLKYDEATLINYYSIQIDTDIDVQYQINNLVLDVEILIKEENIINFIKNSIWKE